MSADGNPEQVNHVLIGRLHFFVIAILAALMFLMISAAYWVAHRWADETNRSVLNSYGELGSTVVRHRIEADFARLRAILSGLTADERYAAAFRSRDTAEFERLTRVRFELLRRDKHLSHLYFITPERRVLLRLHEPQHAGDLIERASLLEAERRRGIGTGIDLGVDSTLRLRVVAPYHAADGQLLGYVEVASELLDVLSAATQNMTSQFFVLVKKDHVNREKWLKFRQEHHGIDDWNRFPDLVLSSQSAPLPEGLARWVSAEDPWQRGRQLARVAADDKQFGLISIPLDDAHGSQIALVLGFEDLTLTYAESRKSLGPIIILVVVGALLILVGVHVGLRALGGRLVRAEHDRHASERSMRYDALTGALSRREFDRQLNRLDYYPARGGVALLMLDLDHFKSINDTYGHMAGDQVLQGFVSIVNECIRGGDNIARFGGEEFAILMLDIEQNAIAALSQRILAAVRDAPLYLSDGRIIRYTVSIGAAFDASGRMSSRALITHADNALYRAKQQGRDRACVDLEHAEAMA